MRALLPLLLVACAPTPGPWIVQGGTEAQQAQAQALVQAAKEVLPDDCDLLREGGELTLTSDPAVMQATSCGWIGHPDWIPAGCAEIGHVSVLLGHWAYTDGTAVDFGPDLTTTYLAHELSHLGLANGKTCNWDVTWLWVGHTGVEMASEDQADAGALLVNAQYRKEHP